MASFLRCSWTSNYNNSREIGDTVANYPVANDNDNDDESYKESEQSDSEQSDNNSEDSDDQSLFGSSSSNSDDDDSDGGEHIPIVGRGMLMYRHNTQEWGMTVLKHQARTATVKKDQLNRLKVQEWRATKLGQIQEWLVRVKEWIRYNEL